MKKYFLLLILTKTILNCEKGCLRCINNICKICDIIQNYKLEKNKCKKFIISNCKIFDLSKKCLKCQTNFFLEKNTKKCLKISEEKKIQNCYCYDSYQNCLFCKENFGFVKNKCVLVVNKKLIIVFFMIRIYFVWNVKIIFF